jgi:hypothetical protein
MPYYRDPLSTAYDGYVRQVMIRAARASRNGQGVRVWIASPRRSGTDAGGRTSHERAFTRSAYYLIWRTPINTHTIPEWSLKLTWSGEQRASSGGRVARAATVRLFPRSKARVRGVSWVKHPELQSGGIGSGRERF